MTNAKVYQGFHDDQKVEEHWYRYMKIDSDPHIWGS